MQSKLKKWKKVSSRVVSNNPYARLEEDTIELPSGKQKKYYVSNRNRTAVSVVGVGKSGEMLIQKEYRYPVNKVVYEYPGGLVDVGEQPLQAAKREFREETGYTAKKWKKLGTYYGSPSRTNLIFHVYCARDLTFVGESPDEAEYLEQEWITQKELRKLAKSGTITSQTMIASSYLFFNQ